MDCNTQRNRENIGSVEVKQAFLSSAISDISTYIQLADTKVSIIMASGNISETVEMTASMVSGYDKTKVGMEIKEKYPVTSG